MRTRFAKGKSNKQQDVTVMRQLAAGVYEKDTV
jgi:hypothetical protein